jgi:hypothetical protein
MTHTHEIKASKIVAFTGPVSRDENRAAHGGVCEIQRCACGAERRMNVNGAHTEIGEWDLDAGIADLNVEALGVTASQARAWLVAMAQSEYGRCMIEEAGYGVIVDAPDHGTDEGTLLVARDVGAYIRRERTAEGWRAAGVYGQ